MKLERVGLIATVVVVLALVLVARGSGAQQAQPVQPGWDTIRVAGDGTGLPYQVWWRDWQQQIVPTLDGGAWAFFSAWAPPLPPVATPGALTSTQRLYASRFDPQQHVWLPATAMPGGVIQFAPTAVVSADNTVHLLYTDRATGADESFATVVYTRTDGNGGWTTPVPVATDPNAGHQLAPAAALDQAGQLHVVWQDQRAVDPAARQGDASNADVFFSSLAGDTWSAPVQLNQRPNPTTYFSRPQLAADGDRLVAIWSVYDQADNRSAMRLEWTTRPIGGEATWAPPQSILERESSQVFFGGRLTDVAADPTGGVVLVYGKRTVTEATPQTTVASDLYLRRLPAGSTTWNGDVLLGSGDRGTYPSVAVAMDGTTYVAYNAGGGESVNVAALALAPGSDTPGPEVILNIGEDGAQGVPLVAVDATGRVWVMYLAERVSGDVNQVRILRGVTIPLS